MSKTDKKTDKPQGLLEGKKTKIVAGGLVALGVALFFGWVHLTPEQIAALIAILVGAGKFALRIAIEKIAEKAEAKKLEGPSA